MMSQIESNINGQQTYLKTLQGLALACLIIFWIKGGTCPGFLIAAGVLLVGSILAWAPLILLARLWIKGMNTVGMLLSRTLLVVLYYLLIAPFSVLYKAVQPQLQKHFFDRSTASTFSDSATLSPRYFEKTW